MSAVKEVDPASEALVNAVVQLIRQHGTAGAAHVMREVAASMVREKQEQPTDRVTVVNCLLTGNG